MRRVLWWVLCATLVVATIPAAAQEQRGSIEGTVRDSQGGVLPGVTVEARSPRLVGVQAAVTDEKGLYRFPALSPGVYEITATLQGFQPAKQSNIALELGKILKVDLTLGVAGVTESVSVTGEAPLIDVKQNAAGANLDSAIIDRIPKGRDFTTVVTTAPGIGDESRNRGIQVDGGSGADNRFVVDGVDTTNVANGISTRRVAPDFIQEVQVKASGYNAEYRASIGGVMSVITKSGGNQFHGGFGTYYGGEKLNGDIRPFLRLSLTNQNVAEYVKTPADDWWSGEWVADLGGPVKRDRLWFYAGYNPSRTNTKRTVTFTKATALGPQTYSSIPLDQILNYNLTGQLSNAIRLKLAATNQWTRTGLGLPSINTDGTSSDNPALYPRVSRTDTFSNSYSAVMDWVVGPTTYINLTGTYLRYGGEGKGTFFSDIRHVFQGSNFQYKDIPASLQQVSGYSDTQASGRQVRDTFTRTNVNADISKYFSWMGQHTLKGGVQVERLGNDVLSGAQAPTVDLYWGASYYSNDGRVLKGKYGYFNVSRLFTEGNVHGDNLGFFVQDGWTLNNRFTLNLGIRTERETSPSYTSYPDVKFGFADKIAPRVGFAWDIKGDSQWKVYGSWGVFYDLLKMTLGRVMLGGDKWMNYFYTLDTYDWSTVGKCGYPPTGSSCGGTFIESFDYRPVANDPKTDLVDPNLKPIRMQELTFGVDHELTKTLSVGTRFVHKWVNRAIEAVCYIDNTYNEVCGVNNPGFGANPPSSGYPTGESLGKYPFGPNLPVQPKAERNYTALEFHVKKRFSQRWSADGSYMYSKLTGNWSGIASSDEAVGGLQPYSGRSMNLLYYAYDASGHVSTGTLATDRPHQIKAQATYDMPWGTVIGLNVLAMSGTPWSTVMTQNNMTFFPYGRGDLGRAPFYTQVNLLLQQEIRLPKKTRLALGVNVQNLFDQDTVTSYHPNPYRDGMNIPDTQFFAGFDPVAVETASGARKDARYGMATAYQPRRTVMLQGRFSF